MQQMHEEICGVFKDGTHELNELEKLWEDCVRFGLGEYLNESHAQFGGRMMAPQTGKLGGKTSYLIHFTTLKKNFI